MAIRRGIFKVYRRMKYKASTGGLVYLPEDPKRVGDTMGGATKVTFHGRLYARDSGTHRARTRRNTGRAPRGGG